MRPSHRTHAFDDPSVDQFRALVGLENAIAGKAVIFVAVEQAGNAFIFDDHFAVDEFRALFRAEDDGVGHAVVFVQRPAADGEAGVGREVVQKRGGFGQEFGQHGRSWWSRG